jgi:hypothetical protein
VPTEGADLQEVALFAVLVAGMRATRAAQPHLQQSDPAPARHKEGMSGGMIEARLDMRQALSFAGAHTAQIGDAMLSGFSSTLVSQISSGVSPALSSPASHCVACRQK